MDTQCSSQAFREEAKRIGAEPVIAHPTNRMKGRKVLCVDRKSRSYGPARLNQLHRKRPTIERLACRPRSIRTRTFSNQRSQEHVHPHVSLPNHNADCRTIPNPPRSSRHDAVTSNLHEINEKKVISQEAGLLPEEL